jgi:D-alanyl-D-alanine carboxypeptidase/D-alanyl-D-alanine-endopeptidase (penicillin-binding protein 4)
MPEFISSLSVIAQDGTTRKRMVRSALAGSAHLKTGSLNDVRALAGYVLAASGKRYLFVCLLNDAKAEQIGPQIQDALLQWAYSNL